MALSKWFARAIFLSQLVALASDRFVHTWQEPEWHFSADNQIIAGGEGKARGRRGQVEKRNQVVTLKEQDCGSGYEVSYHYQK